MFVRGVGINRLCCWFNCHRWGVYLNFMWSTLATSLSYFHINCVCFLEIGPTRWYLHWDKDEVHIKDINENCSIIQQKVWMNIFLLFFYEWSNKVGVGICMNSNPIDCIYYRPHKNENIGIFIINPIEEMMDMSSIFPLRRWPMSRTSHDGYTILQHQLVSTSRLQDIQLLARQLKERKWKYHATKKPKELNMPPKRTWLLSPNPLCQLFIINCCNKEYLRYFAREEVFLLRFEFYGCSHMMRHSKPIHIHSEAYVLPSER